MIIAAIIIGFIIIFFVFLATYISDKEGNNFNSGLALGVVITILSFIECSIVGCIFTEPYPTAMDVYQGKTTLEYKVVDGVKVDSVVIFKNDSTGLNIHE